MIHRQCFGGMKLKLNVFFLFATFTREICVRVNSKSKRNEDIFEVVLFFLIGDEIYVQNAYKFYDISWVEKCLKYFEIMI